MFLSTRQCDYRRRFPEFKRPRIIGFLSLDGSRTFLNDASRLKFVRNAVNSSVMLDLNHNLDATNLADPNRDERITHLLQYILTNEQRLQTLLFGKCIPLHHCKFFCYRGLLTCIANTPYENQEAWRIVATLHKGQIFLSNLYTEENKRRKEEMTEKDKRFTSWGFKFEQYIVSDLPSSEPDLSVPVNQNEEFSLVFTTNLGEHSLVYAAEMDGILCDGNTEPPPVNLSDHDAVIGYLADKKFIELKTNRNIENHKQDFNFRRYKARKWWCQSFLAGVESILCGYRDDLGIVNRLQVHPLAELPRMCRNEWNPDVCFNFLDAFLCFVKHCFSREIAPRGGGKIPEDISTVRNRSLHFEWRPHEPVRVTKYNPDEDAILPDWFLNNFGKYSEIKL